jgi:transcriptional regulator with XRE-family HTH domain
MKRAFINPGSEHRRRRAQAEYLTDLLNGRHLSAREIARRSAMIAEELGKPELAVGHQAVSAWVNGTRHPTGEHRRILATILDVSVANLNEAFDGETEPLNVQSILKPTTVIVHGTFQNYRYTLAIRKEVDLTQPAIYRDWSTMFSIRPVRLIRHLRHIHYEWFGWIPDNSASPMVRYPRCLVPLERVSQRAALRMLDTAESCQRRVWFVYLPGGTLHVGIGYRENRSFSFVRTNGTAVSIESYPFSRVELVGYFTGNALFHLLPATIHRSTPGTIVTMLPQTGGS